mmetsp:Transcript_11998/g.26180  ORF Transcript_11998/g.26180 Transcript_11998/m.26180 type:complete len:153 (+) Transcript_11998:118-576(+)
MKTIQFIQVAMVAAALLIAGASAQTCPCTKLEAQQCTVLEPNPQQVGGCVEVTVPCDPCVCDPVGTLTCDTASGSSLVFDSPAKFIGQCSLQTTDFAACPATATGESKEKVATKESTTVQEKESTTLQQREQLLAAPETEQTLQKASLSKLG